MSTLKKVQIHWCLNYIITRLFLKSIFNDFEPKINNYVLHIFIPGSFVFVSLTLIRSLASKTVTSIKLTKKLNPILTSPRYGVPNICRLTFCPGPSLPMNVVTSPSVD